MPYGSKAMLSSGGGRARSRPLWWLSATIVGDGDPHSHIRWPAVRRALTRIRLDRRPLRVLEIGPGSGAMTHELVETLRPRSITACDIRPPVSSRAVANCVRADVTHLPLSSDSHDVVTLIDVIEHVEADHQALAEAFRVTAPGGYVVVSVPTPAYPRWFGRLHHETIGHVRDGYTRSDLLAALRQAGFTPAYARHHTGGFSLLLAWLYYDRLRCNRAVREVAAVAGRLLGLVDLYLPSATWAGLVATARKPGDERCR